jgi:hypothetical protein
MTSEDFEEKKNQKRMEYYNTKTAAAIAVVHNPDSLPIAPEQTCEVVIIFPLAL